MKARFSFPPRSVFRQAALTGVATWKGKVYIHEHAIPSNSKAAAPEVVCKSLPRRGML
ncbi:hypothetical protein ES705_41956 [subsurface metagenome]